MIWNRITDIHSQGEAVLPLREDECKTEKLKMKKQFENIKLEIVSFCAEDVIRTSLNDNVTDVPEFPEVFQGTG